LLLTGNTGFLGKTIEEILKSEKFCVYGLENIGGKIDITESFSLPDISFDLVVHAAGKAHSIPKTPQEEKRFYDVNVQGTKNLCSALEKLSMPPKFFIFISSVAVYGLETGNEIDENAELRGDSPYAKSKIQAEKFLHSWGLANNVSILILRIPLIAGPNPPGNLGKMIKAIKKGRYISINNGRARRSAILSEDIAICVSKNFDRSGIYNLSDDVHPSFRDFEIIISKQLGKKMPLSLPVFAGKVLGKIGDILHLSFNSSMIIKMENNLTFSCKKAIKELDWRPRPVTKYFRID